jgi:uncharacterized cofD-like protein
MQRLGTQPATMLEPFGFDGLGPSVVAIGGGHGLSKALRAASTYAGRVDAVVSVADDGGSSGRIAPHFDIPPPGDIRKCLLALTPDDSVWRRLFEYRFASGDVAGHSLGNLMLVGLADTEGSFEAALALAERLLGTAGSVIPVCGELLTLEAESNGVRLEGQVTISRHRGRVDSVDVRPPSAAATPRAIAAIGGADQILVGPGSLITSTIAALRVPGITEAVNESSAQLVYIANLITQDGETMGMDGIDHLDALVRLTGVRPPSAIVANEHVIDVSPPLQSVSFDAELAATYGADLIARDLVDDAETWPSHDPIKLGAVLGTLTL